MSQGLGKMVGKTEGKIIDTYRYHRSVIVIKSFATQNSKFNLLHATTQGIKKMLKLQMLDLFLKKMR